MRRSLVVLAAISGTVMSGPVCAAAVAAAAAQMPEFCGAEHWQEFIAEASSRTAVPQERIRAVMLAESAGCAETDGGPTTSAAGAMGLMQIMPATWISMRQRLRLGLDPYDPRDNILAGAAVLQDLCNRYGVPGCIAAYHAGARRFEEYLWGGRPLPADTLAYVARVQRWLARTDTQTPVTKSGAARTFDDPFDDRALFEHRPSTPDRTQRTGPFVPLTRSERHAGLDGRGQAHVQSP